jgi:hypothetical protein
MNDHAKTPSKPMQDLVEDLRRLMREQDARPPRARPRWLPWAASAVVLVGAPSVALATGAINVGDHTLADGSRFSHTVSSLAGADATKTCDVTRIDEPGDSGAISGDGCGPSGAQTTDPVTVLSVLSERDDTTLVSGIASPTITSLTFIDDKRDRSRRRIALEARRNEDRRSFTFAARRRGGTLVAVDADGREVARASVPELPAGTPAVYPSQPSRAHDDDRSKARPQDP